MTMDPKPLARRQFLRFALAAAAVAPLGGALASCAAGGGSPSGSASTPAGAVSADNPFGVAAGSTVDAVIFNGGYGIDYVQFAADKMQKVHSGVTVKVSPSTKIAQELQPRFVGGNPPDLIDNSGAEAIGFSTIIAQLEDLTSVIDANNLEGTKIRDTPVRRRARAGHVRRQARRAQLRADGLRAVVLGHTVRGERLDPAEDVGRGVRPRRQGQGEGQVPLRLGQGSGDLLPDAGHRLRHQGRRRRRPAVAGEPQARQLVAAGRPVGVHRDEEDHRRRHVQAGRLGHAVHRRPGAVEQRPGCDPVPVGLAGSRTR